MTSFHYVLAAIVSLAPSAALAQGAGPFSTMGADNKDPIQIEADRLSISDKDKKATFSGNVNVVQGEMTMKAQNLVVFYAGSAVGAGAPAGGNAAQQITRIEAQGGVSVRQKDQTATGEKAVYDALDQKVRLTGNVVLAQGPSNVLRGCGLVVDLRTRSSEIESGKSCGRVSGVFTPGARPPGPEASKR